MADYNGQYTGQQIDTAIGKVSELEGQMSVSAETDVAHQMEMDAIVEQMRGGNFGDIAPTSVSVDSEQGIKVKGQSLIIEGSGVPTKAPDFAGQMYIDTTNNVAYICCTSYTGDSDFGTAGDWKRITNA